ncbi:restriction endonuclease subunit S [Halobacillus sp. A1]|uniref:restriction endonuclease subunit S n=1 Tax=Halobacillus sp. A1 TaxID=2880262 RepID=UPI0020A6C497|nr:restriction endonuclease subunit S [Halobacillus sp. A1]MCP3032620.1 restriction endonuclease subunit S [Halobacillus sp. A1]
MNKTSHKQIPKTYKFINTVKYKDVNNWSTYSLLGNQLKFSNKYPLVKLGDILTRNKTAIRIEDKKIYKRPTISLNNKGIKLRNEVEGKKIGTKMQFLIKAGQFLLSKIDARNGAFGVVPTECDNGIITGNFWAFDVNYKAIDPYFLNLLTSSKEFHLYCQSASVGTTGRHYLQEKFFLDIEIPLPPLPIQKSIVRKYNRKMEKTQVLQNNITTIQQDVEQFILKILGIKTPESKIKKGLQFINYKDMNLWSLEYLLGGKHSGSVFSSIYPTQSLGELCIGRSGGTPSKKSPDYWNGNIPWVSPKDMKTDLVSDSIDKVTNKAIDEKAAKIIPENSILAVVRSGILQHTVPIAVNTVPVTINQDLRAFELKSTVGILKEYLHYFLKYAQKLLLKLVKSSTTVQSIDSKKLNNFPIPKPPLEIQREIIKYVEVHHKKIEKSEQLIDKLKQKALNQFEQEVFEINTAAHN